MNAIEVYRRLPRTNCGRCGPGRCMPLAVAVAAGTASAAECPELSPEVLRELGAVAGKGDWREAFIAELRREVAEVPLAEVAPGLGAQMRGGSLAVRLLGREYLVVPDGRVVADGAEPSPWVQILLLHYVRTRGSVPLAGAWVSFGQLRGGMVKAAAFARDCEEPLRELMERDPAGARRGLERLGGAPEPGQPAPFAWRVLPLPRIPVLILFWPGDEEFPAKLRILLDATADRFLDVETLLFLGEGLVRNVASGPDAALHD